jgi:hypothetical protein
MKVLFLLLICWVFFFQRNSCGITEAKYQVKDYQKYIVGTWASFDDVEGYREKPSKFFVIFNEDGTIKADYSPLEREFGEKIIKTSKYEFKNEKIIKTSIFPKHLLIVPHGENELNFEPELGSLEPVVDIELIYGTRFKRVK